MKVLPCCCGSQLAMFNPFGGDQAVGDLLNQLACAPHHENFKTTVGIKMDVQRRLNHFVVLMLQVGQPFHEFRDMMVIDNRDGANRLFIIIPFFFDEVIADQVA